MGRAAGHGEAPRNLKGCMRAVGEWKAGRGLYWIRRSSSPLHPLGAPLSFTEQCEFVYKRANIHSGSSDPPIIYLVLATQAVLKKHLFSKEVILIN